MQFSCVNCAWADSVGGRLPEVSIIDNNGLWGLSRGIPMHMLPFPDFAPSCLQLGEVPVADKWGCYRRRGGNVELLPLNRWLWR